MLHHFAVLVAFSIAARRSFARTVTLIGSPVEGIKVRTTISSRIECEDTCMLMDSPGCVSFPSTAYTGTKLIAVITTPPIVAYRARPWSRQSAADRTRMSMGGASVRVCLRSADRLAHSTLPIAAPWPAYGHIARGAMLDLASLRHSFLPSLRSKRRYHRFIFLRCSAL